MNKSLTIVAGVLAIIGLVINIAVDRDNVFDMTLSGLWLVTLIVAFLGAFVGRSKTSQSTGGSLNTGASPSTMVAGSTEN
ncbi:MAG: hypothetical protein JRN15_07080 [Nitrososphaerota archaeon]|nr:hypothetical protein [Nitrososphaerota archaeon]